MSRLLALALLYFFTREVSGIMVTSISEVTSRVARGASFTMVAPDTETGVCTKGTVMVLLVEPYSPGIYTNNSRDPSTSFLHEARITNTQMMTGVYLVQNLF